MVGVESVGGNHRRDGLAGTGRHLQYTAIAGITPCLDRLALVCEWSVLELQSGGNTKAVWQEASSEFGNSKRHTTH